MPQMRTINEAYKAIKEADPETALNPHALRRLVLNGDIPSVKSGNRYLIDLEGLQQYLSNPIRIIPPASNYGKIRPISENR